MNIVIENHIPFIRGIFEKAGHCVTYLAPEQIDREAVKDADALVVRTRTRCDKNLLEGTRVRIIATATIGTDHIDLPYCRAKGIAVHNAPGCNAPAVAQYVLSSIHALGLDDATIGIVGVGHVGSLVDRWARANGMRTLLCDPPIGINTPLSIIAAEADVITFHTPLDNTTRHMADAAFFAACRKKPVIINAARGAVVNTRALTDALKSGRVSGAVIDCWEGEPDVPHELMRLADIATPHIAGYSLQGKRRATAMVVNALDPGIGLPVDPMADCPTIEEIAASYNPMADSAAFKQAPSMFEQLRNSYDYRNEPHPASNSAL